MKKCLCYRKNSQNECLPNLRIEIGKHKGQPNLRVLQYGFPYFVNCHKPYKHLPSFEHIKFT